MWADNVSVCFTAKEGDLNIGSYLKKIHFLSADWVNVNLEMIFPALCRLELEFPQRRWAVDNGERPRQVIAPQLGQSFAWCFL